VPKQLCLYPLAGHAGRAKLAVALSIRATDIMINFALRYLI